MRRWRKTTWLVLGWTALMVVGYVYIDGSVGGLDDGSARAAEGLGIAFIGMIWFIVPSLIWSSTRPRRGA